MSLAPLVRIALRYGVGFFAGQAAGDALAMDDDLVLILAVAAGAVIESAYGFAKKKGWAT